MKLYHVTSLDAALMVLVEGFHDAPHPWLPEQEAEGVWLTESPLSVHEGLPPDWNTVLEVELDVPAAELDRWHWQQEHRPPSRPGHPYAARQGPPQFVTWGWLVPAYILNTQGTTRLREQTEASEAEIREVLDRYQKMRRDGGMIGEQLEEDVRRVESELRRWEPPPPA